MPPDLPELFDVLIPDGRRLHLVLLDEREWPLMTTTRPPGLPYQIRTYACIRKPSRVVIEFED